MGAVRVRIRPAVVGGPGGDGDVASWGRAGMSRLGAVVAYRQRVVICREPGGWSGQ